MNRSARTDSECFNRTSQIRDFPQVFAAALVIYFYGSLSFLTNQKRIMVIITTIIFFFLARKRLVCYPPPSESPEIRWHWMFFKAKLAGNER